MLMFTKNMFKALYMSDFTFELSCPVEGAFDGCGQAYPYPPARWTTSRPSPTLPVKNRTQWCPTLQGSGRFLILTSRTNINQLAVQWWMGVMHEETRVRDSSVRDIGWKLPLSHDYNPKWAPLGMHMYPSYFLRSLVGDRMEAAKKFLKYAVK